MARSIYILFKDGTERRFEQRPRAGGSWTLSADLTAPAFVIVTDEYGHQTAYPVADIRRIDVEPEPRGGW